MASKAPTYLDYRFYSRIEEHQGQPIYGICFNDADPNLSHLFATVSGHHACIYRIPDQPNPLITLDQLYSDIDTREVFYTCVWMVDHISSAPFLVCAGLSGTIKILKCSERTAYKSLLGHVAAVNELRRMPVDPNILLSASKDRSIRLWNVHTGVCISVFGGEAGHLNEVLSIDFNLDCTRIVSCGMDHAVKIWFINQELQDLIALSYTNNVNNDLPPDNDDKRRAPFPTKFVQFPVYSTDKVHSNYIDSVRFFGDLILSKSVEEKIVLWEPIYQRHTVNQACTISVIKEFPFPDSNIWYVRFALDPSMRFMAIGNLSGKLFCWEVDALDDPGRILSNVKSSCTIRCVTFNYNSSFLLASAEDGSVWVWRRKSSTDPLNYDDPHRHRES
uniref:Uncharacterized protein n=1 Tax=Spongospora subterranea TaxID=70186 RepID=A0A0H5RAK6_9EUKA|eukprot:CRZ11195.1 hypothetical protein [Spongospora subterranea]